MSKFTTEDQATHPSVSPPSAGRLTWYSLGGGAYAKTPAGVVIPLSSDSGYPLFFGGKGAIGQHFFVNGIASGGVVAALDQRTEFVVPSPGTIAAISWNTKLGNATTVFRIKKNGVTVDTVALTGAQGFNATLSGAVLLAGDRVSVEYFAGQVPDETNLSVYVV